MGASLMDKVILLFGFASLVHAAFSAAQHHTFLRLTEQEFQIPIDITIQAIISLLVTMAAVTRVAGDFKEIRASDDLKSRTWHSVNNRPSFYTFNHRGRFIHRFIHDEPVDKSSLE